MKTNFIKILTFSLLVIMISCTKELDFAPYNETPPAKFWVTEADANAALNACYGSILNWGIFEPATFALAEIASGNTVKGASASDQADIYPFLNFTFLPPSIHFSENWNYRYNLINACNQVITNVPDIAMDEGVKNSIIGEARFIHAWCYFELARTFGEVVLYDGIPQNASYNIPKSSLTDIYAVIEKDLEFAAANCRTTPWPTNMKGRVTSWTAKAFLAKVKMYEASGENFTDENAAINGTTWNDVKTVTDEVIASGFYKLFTQKGDSSFFYLFRIANENCDESIFEVQCGTSSTVKDIARSSAAQYQWATNLNGWGFNAPSDKMCLDWEARTDDALRYHQSIAYQGQTLPDGDKIGPAALAGTSAFNDPNATGIARARYNFKMYESSKDDKGNGLGGWQKLNEQNIRLYRYAEVLLIDAEAEFRLGNLQEAVNSINLVRARVKETPLTIANITLQQILDERRFELAFENDYFYDLVRTGQAQTVLGPSGFTKPKNNFYPLPQLQIDISIGVLEQNKYW